MCETIEKMFDAVVTCTEHVVVEICTVYTVLFIDRQSEEREETCYVFSRIKLKTALKMRCMDGLATVYSKNYGLYSVFFSTVVKLTRGLLSSLKKTYASTRKPTQRAASLPISPQYYVTLVHMFAAGNPQ